MIDAIENGAQTSDELRSAVGGNSARQRITITRLELELDEPRACTACTGKGLPPSPDISDWWGPIGQPRGASLMGAWA